MSLTLSVRCEGCGENTFRQVLTDLEAQSACGQAEVFLSSSFSMGLRMPTAAWGSGRTLPLVPLLFRELLNKYFTSRNSSNKLSLFMILLNGLPYFNAPRSLSQLHSTWVQNINISSFRAWTLPDCPQVQNIPKWDWRARQGHAPRSEASSALPSLSKGDVSASFCERISLP